MTCAFCGQAYGPGTPAHGAEVLTQHIRICAKHPQRNVERIARNLLNGALKMIGAETADELRGIKVMMAAMARDDAAVIENVETTTPLIDAAIEALETNLGTTPRTEVPA